MSKTITSPEEIYSLSDEEIMNLDPSTLPVAEEVQQETQVEDESTEADANEATAEAGNEAEGDEDVAEEGEAASTEEESSEEEPIDEGSKRKSAKTPKEKSETAEAATKDPEPKGNEVDYKSAYEQIFRPFKANGKDITVDSVDDVVALMQMGANYNKKMASLKPNLKVLKLLENNGLLSEEKLNFLIDLDKRNPDAIRKLIKDSEIDPLDLDSETKNDYKPTAYTVSEKQLELDEVLEEISEAPTFNRLTSLVSKGLDSKSKTVVAENPALLKVLNSHMASGVFDQINKEIDRETTFGRLKGLSYLEAYKAVGDAIQARGGFDHLVEQQVNERKPAPKNTAPERNKVEDNKREQKRRAAGIATSASKTAKEPDFNPLALSDEDFGKLTAKKFY